MRTTETSQMLFGRTTTILSALEQMAGECEKPGWDGNGASALDGAAVQNAQTFVRALPDDLPMPELAPEPDGSISLDWIAARHRMFSLSVGPDNRLAYAWLDGAEKGHAVAVFDGMTIPPKIRDGIQSIVGHVNTALWSA